MTDYYIILGFVSSVVGILGYIPYYRDVLRGTTKPHPFSWIGFGLLTGISFFAQILEGGGPGAWVMGISSIGIFGIAALSLSRGERHITIFDWVCFAGALSGIALWLLTEDPLWAVIIITITDSIAFAPTYRKAFFKPHEETISLYVLSVAKYVISLFALKSFTVTTALFPLSLVISNGLFVAVLIYRRWQLARASEPATMAPNE